MTGGTSITNPITPVCKAHFSMCYYVHKNICKYESRNLSELSLTSFKHRLLNRFRILFSLCNIPNRCLSWEERVEHVKLPGPDRRVKIFQTAKVAGTRKSKVGNRLGHLWHTPTPHQDPGKTNDKILISDQTLEKYVYIDYRYSNISRCRIWSDSDFKWVFLISCNKKLLMCFFLQNRPYKFCLIYIS